MATWRSTFTRDIGSRHVGEPAFVQTKPSPRRQVDGTARHPLEGAFDRSYRILRCQQRANVVFAQIERHGRVSSS